MLTVNFSPFPTLYTERLELRQITDADVNDVFEMRSNPTLMQYIGRPIAQSTDDAQKLIDVIKNLLNSNDGITWGVTVKGNPKVIGTLGFWRIEKDNHRTEIGYMLNHDYHGKGIMHEAMVTAIEYAFKVMDVHTIEASINPTNAASIALAERHNFVREGHFKDIYYFNGSYRDTYIYSLLNPFH
jgi:[ribosomal protein S5]-alanine N-acetyltransferase